MYILNGLKPKTRNTLLHCITFFKSRAHILVIPLYYCDVIMEMLSCIVLLQCLHSPICSNQDNAWSGNVKYPQKSPTGAPITTSLSKLSIQ